ncbi:MAG: Wzz/FepE/Etk N-terminal domain-containing protein [Candidatus Latescibacter sp.]|nr:Wzz/FepE/Etk N-terminal domain-containing protein [Candidatus Latescibacter sp.]
MENKEINILEYVYIFYKARKLILLNFIVICLLTGVASIFMTRYYKTATILMPPHEIKKGFGFAEQLASQVTTLRLGTQGSPTDIFMGILKSQTVEIILVDKFNLVKFYGVPDRDTAVARLKKLTNVSLTKEGLIKVDYEDKDPVRAADLCNMYIVVLDSVNQSINQRVSRERADFIEQMLIENYQALKQAEMDLKKFQTETKAISPFQQERIALTVTAELEMDIMRIENQLKEMKSKSFTNDNPMVKDSQKKLQFREEQLHDMRFGGSKEGRETLFVPLQESAALVMEYQKLSRRITALGMLEQLLRNQYEESRIEQVNNTSTVSVIDRARPPIKPSRPKPFLMVLIAGAASIFFSLVTIIMIEYFNRLSGLSMENQRKLEQLSRFMRIDR